MKAHAALLALAACAPDPTTADGRVVDARTAAPVADLEVRLTTEGDVCPTITTRTDAEGRWTAARLCGEGTWSVGLGAGWRLAEPVRAGPGLELAAWRAPPAEGVYTVAGTAVTPVLTHTVLDVATLFGTAEEVRFPVEIPGAVPRIAPGDALLLVGEVLPELAFAPLIGSAERRWFGTKEAPQAFDPWVYLGVRFTSDTVWERVPATLDSARVTTVEGEPALRYVAGDALPAGRYALPTADGARAWLFDFGAAEPGATP